MYGLYNDNKNMQLKMVNDTGILLMMSVWVSIIKVSLVDLDLYK